MTLMIIHYKLTLYYAFDWFCQWYHLWKIFKIYNYGSCGSRFNKSVIESTSDLTFKRPKLGTESSDVNNNLIYFLKNINRSAIVIVSSYAGIHYKSAKDLRNQLETLLNLLSSP